MPILQFPEEEGGRGDGGEGGGEAQDGETEAEAGAWGAEGPERGGGEQVDWPRTYFCFILLSN